MKYELVEVHKHFELQKGISYTSKELVQESETGLLTLNAFNVGGGFKLESEKPFGGELKPDFLLINGDVLLAMTEQDAGLLASPLTIESDYSSFSNLTFSLDVARVRGISGKIHPKFLYNVLRIPAFRKRAAYGDTGSTVQRLPYEALGELQIPCPPLKVQLAIINIIDALDSKIHLNKRTAETLEQTAQTIFKSWFVDFDPVHAKSRGLEPEGLDIDTAGLFPDEFQESDLGDIPKGFRQVRFDSFCEVLLGGTPSKSKPDYWDGSIPWINSGAINDYRIVEATRFITELGLSKSSCKLLPKGTTVIAITGATLGQFSRVEIETTANQSVIGIRAFDNAFKDYVYLWVSKNIGLLTAKSTGGAQQHINRNDVCEQFVLLPPPELALKFSQFMEPIFDSISNLLFQNLTLARLRDSLLPMLVTGDLGISDEILGE
jgi:type I restriction enzyme S subunit